MRYRGSCKFDPYYKVQVWSSESLAWIDIQRSHETAEQAHAAAPAGRMYRLMHVTETGRTPGSPHDPD